MALPMHVSSNLGQHTSALILAMESASSRRALRILKGLLRCNARQLVSLGNTCMRCRPCLQARRSLQDGLLCPARSRIALTWTWPSSFKIQTLDDPDSGCCDRCFQALTSHTVVLRRHHHHLQQ